MYSFEYPSKLQLEADKLPVPQRGRFWAEQVAVSPPDGDRAEWAKLDVEIASFGTDTSYRAVVLAAADNVAEDPVVVADFVRVIGKPRAEGLTEDLYATVVTRTLNADGKNRAARTALVDWALAQISTPEVRRNAVLAALNRRHPSNRPGLVELTAGLADKDLGVAVAEQVDALNDRERREAEEAELQRAARAAQVSNQQQAESDIRRDPEGQFAAYASRAGLTLENVNEADLSGQSELLHAGRQLMEMRLSGAIEEVPPLASAVLDRATHQRATGTSFNGVDGWNSDRALNLYEELPARLAESPDEFWANAAGLVAARQLGPSATSRLYTVWREQLIERRLAQQGQLAAADVPGLEPPPGIAVTVTPQDGVIQYESTDKLIADLRTYFVPGANRSMTTPVTGVSRDEMVGSASAAAALDDLNHGWDVRNMDRLEEEIRDWDSSPDKRYVDSEAEAGGTPYKYGPGLFSGHGIYVERGDDGRPALRFSGGGRGPSGVDMLNQFAAFHDKSVQYDGSIGLTYTVVPPDDIATYPLHQSTDLRPHEVGDVTVPLPLDRITEHLQQISGCTAADLEAVTATLKTPRGELTGEPMTVGSAQVTIGSYAHHLEYAEVNGEPVSVAPVVQYDDRVTMLLPSVQVDLTFPDAQQHSRVATGLLASGSMSRDHPTGYIGAHRSFHFNEATSRAFRQAAASSTSRPHHSTEQSTRAGRESR